MLRQLAAEIERLKQCLRWQGGRDGVMSTVPLPPNEAGESPFIVRWVVETPHGWLAAYDKGAFDAYGDARAAEERERCVSVVRRWAAARRTDIDAQPSAQPQQERTEPSDDLRNAFKAHYGDERGRAADANRAFDEFAAGWQAALAQAK